MQLKAQQRAKQSHSDTMATSVLNTDQSQYASDDTAIVHNSTPLNKAEYNQSEEPNVGTLVTIGTSSDNAVVVKATRTKTLQSAVVIDGGGEDVVARVDGIMDSNPSLGIIVDGNSDSALPTSFTTKSSKTSGSCEENYSESYC